MTLSRDQILAASDLETREVEVPEWGGSVLVRALSGKERDAYEASLMLIRGKTQIPNLANMRAKLVARAIVDEDGKRLFTDQDVNALGLKSAAALNRVHDVVQELSGLNEGATEDAEENSDAAQSGDSTSAWPESSDAPSENS